jgi:hypothetical protein
LQVADAFMLLIDNLLQLQHFFLKLSLSCSVGNTMNSFLILKLSALQIDCWEDDFFNIGRDLGTDCFEDGPCRV